jgi:hypothetical protein
MAATETNGRKSGQYPQPGDAEFAGIRADLARLFMQHRLDIGLTLASDEWIESPTILRRRCGSWRSTPSNTAMNHAARHHW